MFRRITPAEPRPLDLYDIAYLVGGVQWVAQTVFIALQERGVITIRRARVRVVERRADHPVERALLELCPRSRRVDDVVPALCGGPEMAEIRARLAAGGLLGPLRRRPTRAGRRRLEAAERDDAYPSYAFHGLAAVPAQERGRAISAATPVASGGLGYWGRRLVITSAVDAVDAADAADNGIDAHPGSGSGTHGWSGGQGGDHGGHGGGGGHHSCGGGGGGGGGE
ncbi:TIGR04222 domain-containing membrane protein [Streptomyces hygroscopicus]|uniref:TIGR04222 domain-containing membrane protein n=1 Tax=Streptomyces hygroscopicus TaxID=1912 RepID=UPI00099FF69B|nr:TIGR04222 domain-containing membrane protein [Streptomyces hygroscopicus]